MKIYTKKGDDGSTSLAGGVRVGKDDLRVEAYGTVDELCAHTAHLRDLLAAADGPLPIIATLEKILCDLMSVAGSLAMDRDAMREKSEVYAIKPDVVHRLEEEIDRTGAQLPALRQFTLPGGHPLVSYAHICRTVCRRAERACVRASHQWEMDTQAMAYLNRLSDYFYVLGRRLSMHFGAEEKCWIPE